jgi:hypothetical protein
VFAGHEHFNLEEFELAVAGMLILRALLVQDAHVSVVFTLLNLVQTLFLLHQLVYDRGVQGPLQQRLRNVPLSLLELLVVELEVSHILVVDRFAALQIRRIIILVGHAEGAHTAHRVALLNHFLRGHRFCNVDQVLWVVQEVQGSHLNHHSSVFVAFVAPN